MRIRPHTAIALAVMSLSAGFAAHRAEACGIAQMQPMSTTHWTLAAPAAGKALNTRVAAAQARAPVPGGNAPALYMLPRPGVGRSPITGLYQFTFTSQGSEGIPDGVVIDQGLTAWHDDGTEIMNSGRPPMTQSFCMGAWKQTSRHAYKLNHYALSWDPTGTVFIGPTRIHEQVELAQDGNSFSGAFSIDQFDTDGTTVLAHVQGTVAATRLTADSE